MPVRAASVVHLPFLGFPVVGPHPLLGGLVLRPGFLLGQIARGDLLSQVSAHRTESLLDVRSEFLEVAIRFTVQGELHAFDPTLHLFGGDLALDDHHDHPIDGRVVFGAGDS